MLVKIHVEMCQFTRIPLTRFKVSFMLQNFPQCRQAASRARRFQSKPRRFKKLQRLGDAIFRETGVSRHQGAQLSPPPSNFMAVYCTEGFKEGHQLSQARIMPRGVSLVKSNKIWYYSYTYPINWNLIRCKICRKSVIIIYKFGS